MKISELPDEQRKFVRVLIKLYCKTLPMEGLSIYQQANKCGIGLEETEEIIEQLIDKKMLIVECDGDTENPNFRIRPR